MFENLSDRLESAMKKIKGYGVITENNISDVLREVRLALLEADVNYQVVKEFTNNVKEKALGEEVRKSLKPSEVFLKILKDELLNLLGEGTSEIETKKNPTILMLVGLQGSGKTTTIGKLGNLLRKKYNKKPLFVACDIYRPAAIEQLKTIGKELNIPVYEEGIKNPNEIVRNALEYAKENGESLLDVTRPTFGGNLFGTIVCKDTRPQMATIRPKVFELAPTDTTRTGEVEEFTPTWRTTDPQVFVEKVIEKVKADVDITKADILVGAGRGAENCLDVLQKVADELGGVVCCTRAVVEDGFLDKDRQVGQTGKTVRPSLYIACGISGAVQHCAGMDKSDLIISINRDPQAEIFNISNMGFVGDCATVLPLLVESIKAAKAE